MADFQEFKDEMKKYIGPMANVAGRGISNAAHWFAGHNIFASPIESTYTIVVSTITDVTNNKAARMLCNAGVAYTGAMAAIKLGEATFKIANGNHNGFADAGAAIAHGVDAYCMLKSSNTGYLKEFNGLSPKENFKKDLSDLVNRV